MRITQQSNISRIRLCLDAATEFGLSKEGALEIVETQISGIVEHFDTLCAEIGMSPTTLQQLRRRAVLNPDIFSGCGDLDPRGW